MKTYLITYYDRNTTLGNCPTIQGDKAIDSCKTFLTENNDTRRPKRHGGQDVDICLCPIVVENGKTLISGSAIWYKLT